MKPSNLRESMLAAFERFWSEAGPRWSKESVRGLVNPRGFQNSLEDPEIQKLLRYFETINVIKLVFEDDIYLEVKDPAQWKVQNK